MSHPSVNQQTAARVLREAFDKVVDSQQERIAAAAALVVESLTAGGVIQVFGTGHSRSFASEIAGRAGGLVPANRISLSDLTFYGDLAPDHPVVVAKIDNTRASAPQTAIDRADMVVEQTVEGGVTRLAALYYSKLPGNVVSITVTWDPRPSAFAAACSPATCGATTTRSRTCSAALVSSRSA